MAGNKVLIVDADAASRNFVGAALQKEEYQILQAASGKEGLIVALRDRPGLIIVDPVLSDLAGEELALRLRQDLRTASTPLIALSSDLNPTRARTCQDAGYAAYMVKSAEVMPLLIKTTNHLSGRAAVPASPPGGRLIVFLSAKGGTGTSSLCANIATNIVESKPETHVAVVDLVLPIGSIADIIGYRGEQNLITVADMPANMITPKFLQSVLEEQAKWRFHLLAGSPDPASGNRLNVGAIDDIVDALLAAYDYVMIDLGRSLSRISLPLIQRASLIALIVSTDLSTVDLTKTVWEYLHNQGVQAPSVYAILNRAVGLEGLSKTEAEKTIGLPIKTSMPYLGSNFALANNQHLPFLEKFPGGTPDIIFKDMAKQMVELVASQRLAVQ